MDTKQIKLSQAKINRENPRQIGKVKFQKLIDSILVFPKMLRKRPPVVDDKMVVLGGNMRLQAIKEIAKMDIEQLKCRISMMPEYRAMTEGEQSNVIDHWGKWLKNPEIDVIIADDLSESERRQFIIKDNASFGQWDYDALANEWDNIDLERWGVDVWTMPPSDFPPSSPSSTNRNERPQQGKLDESETDGIQEEEPISKFEDYDGFVDKFKLKKTTDDCYTPPEIYDCVKEWVNDSITPLDDLNIVRPFYPGGDYQAEKYSDRDVVLDNPPFSIMAKIIDFYTERNIRFFLFAPSLTLFSSPRPGVTYIVANAAVVYENGAVVNTGFVTNMEGKNRVWVAGDLNKKIADVSRKLREKKAPELANITYPKELLTSAIIGKVAIRGISFRVPIDECHFVRKLDNQSGSIFGGGYLLSEKAAAEKAAAEKAAAEKAAAEKAAAEKAAAEKAAAEKAAAEKVELSERELEIVSQLSKAQRS